MVQRAVKAMMRILATGQKSPNLENPIKLRNHKPRGFTLIEILVVLVIMGVMLGLVAVNFGMDARQQLQQEGHRLALLMSHASSLARTTGQAVAWLPSKQGYTFSQRSSKQNDWEVINNDSTLRPRVLPESMRISNIHIAGKPAKLDEKIIFSPSGINPAFDLTLTTEGAHLRVTGDMLGKALDLPAQETP